MTQQSAIILQNRWCPETSRVKSKQEGNKKVQGGSRVSGDTGITFCMSIQIHAQCCWSSWSEATCIFACFCFISHLTLCAIDRGFRLCHLCSYEIYISNDKTQNCVKPHFQNGNTENMQGCKRQLFSLSIKSSRFGNLTQLTISVLSTTHWPTNSQIPIHLGYANQSG